MDVGKPKPRLKERKSRRRLGSRSYKNYSDEMLEVAVELVKSRSLSSRDAEKQFNIPRRTILNRAKGRHGNTVGHPKHLSAEEERNIVKVLTAAGDFGSPLTKLDLRLIVFDYLMKNSREEVFNGKPPGKHWVMDFLKRHANDLTVRATQNIKRARAEKGAEEMLNYFNNLKDTIDGIPPSNIMNFDETNLSDDPGASKAIFRRGVKYPERVLNSTKGCISVMFSATADGKCLPVYVVYKAENMYTEWVRGGPTDARYNCSKSGWFDGPIFENYFNTVIMEWAKNLPGPKVVICDNLSSHLSVNVIELCQENEIKFVFLPPNSTHITQPLDVAYFGPLKKVWRKILLQYKIENPQQTTLNKKHFPKLLYSLIENIQFEYGVITKSGFKATGIFPFNPRSVLKKIPEYHENIAAYDIDQALLDYLKSTRAPKPMELRRNKKIKTEPGSSVTLLDLQNHVTKSTKKKDNLLKSKPKEEKKISYVKTKKHYESRQILDEQTELLVENCIEDECFGETNKDNESFGTTQILDEQTGLLVTVENCKRENKIKILSDIKLKYNPTYSVYPNASDIPNLAMPSTSASLKNSRNIKIKITHTESNSDTDISDKISLHDSTDTEQFSSEEDNIKDTDVEEKENINSMNINQTCSSMISDRIDLQIEDYVLVRFETSKKPKYFIGKISDMLGIDIEIDFLRKKNNTSYYYWPQVKDVAQMFLHDIVKILSTPITTRRGLIKFKDDLSNYQIC